MNIKEKIGIRLRELRTAKGLSQEKLSFECELDRTYIASIEQGKRNVSAVNIEKIAKTFEMSVSDFFNSHIFQ
ncbi:MAG TPA: helix-turn-helix transcriptional regulator [Bacteroidales bacterium]|nr:helix-turn-helix transcriptional regulator [Bacteroidales bacterium]